MINYQGIINDQVSSKAPPALLARVLKIETWPFLETWPLKIDN
jgi:hypothetical protein